ncbi:tRNA pseudouridine(38-40) synthase TruA [Halotalea alkalilenta]|uniref:tRNA pseudouridine synthase A n=1 Tax=Halotalea alkalilenta TaxID=376489 RepID=A0A172YFA6_9GAMM|nr:tRNA pseudouridine(38-40) synthase TruA [Halotalea alkalilenta]ANF57796.1 tRNA pseudouridine(38,39,40) synthase TruA [Halotalea alkalilenta]
MSLFAPLDESSPLTGRIALGIEYEGSAYYGWQRLRHGPSVQQTLEEALARVARAPVELVVSGRTDTGVHASRQIAHFDAPSPRSQKAWVMGANANLPRDVRVHWAVSVADDFHARASAIARRYRYLIYNAASAPALGSRQLTWHRTPLDERRMHAAAQVLVGEHDFSAFRAAKCQSSTPWRHLHFIEVRRFGPLVMIDVQANAFLHHMIRNIAGTLLAIGDGRRPVEWCAELLADGVRAVAGATAPAQGLHFIDARYAAIEWLPRTPLGPLPLAFLGEWSGEREVPIGEYLRRIRKRRAVAARPCTQTEGLDE